MAASLREGADVACLKISMIVEFRLATVCRVKANFNER